MIRSFIIYTQFFLLCGCDGIIANHYASRGNQPIDGSSLTKDFKVDKVYYPKGNLDYLNDRRSRDNKVFFASANMYNEIKYNVAKDYLKTYNKYLKVDAKELEAKLKSDQTGISRDEIAKKMESGNLPVYPLKGNILMMQKLKDEEDKIAFPDYMDDFLEIYINQKNNKKDEKKSFEDIDVGIFYAVNGDFRDVYVNYFLSWNEDYANINKKIYSEKKINSF